MGEILNQSERVFLSLALLLITFLVFVNVVLRYGFAASPLWAEEVTRYTIIWITFIGGSLCVREDYHPRVKALIEWIPERMIWIVTLSIALMGFLFSIAMAYYGIHFVQNAFTFGSLTPTHLCPMYIPLIGLPLGGALMAVRYFHLICHVIKKRLKEAG